MKTLLVSICFAAIAALGCTKESDADVRDLQADVARLERQLTRIVSDQPTPEPTTDLRPVWKAINDVSYRLDLLENFQWEFEQGENYDSQIEEYDGRISDIENCLQGIREAFETGYYDISNACGY